MSEDDYLHGVDVGIDLYMDRAHIAEALAADRLKLLRRCASHLSFILADYSEFGAVYHPNISEITDLINELAKELGDD